MRLLLLLVVLCSACGGSSAGPTPVPLPTPGLITLTGHVTATNGGQPLAGIQATLGASSVTTDGTGGFSAQTTPTASLSLSLAGSGIVPRSLMIALTASRTLSVDAIQLGGGFEVGFYRQLVRNGFEGGNEAVRRLTEAPNVYIRTIRDDGVAVDIAMLNTVEQVIRDAMPRWSGFTPPSVVRGTDTQAGRAGWVTVAWPGAVAADRVCGFSDVGRTGGTIQLWVPTASACGCDGTSRIRPRVIRHELGHAMGFWHTDSQNDVMVASSSACDLAISPRELAAAAIAYTRPVGNTDPDTDPVGAVSLAPMRIH